VIEADVASSGVKLFIVQFLASSECEAIGASDSDMTGCVLIKKGVIEKVSALGDRGTCRDKRYFTKSF
jgi:hypothetical protein